MPTSCTATLPTAQQEGTAVVTTWPVRCDGGLVGRTLAAVAGIADSQADVLLRIELADGRSINHVLSAESPSVQVPAETRRRDVFATHAPLGVEHILLGFDHLLFVLGLVLLVTEIGLPAGEIPAALFAVRLNGQTD